MTKEIDDTYYKHRMSICKKCTSYQTTFRLCGECGCFMPAKALLKFVSCPVGKWEKVEENND